MLCARAWSIIFLTFGTIGTQRGRTPQLLFMTSSTSSAVVLGSTVTGFSSGLGAIFTLPHWVGTERAPKGSAAQQAAAANSTAQNFIPAVLMTPLPVDSRLGQLRLQRDLRIEHFRHRTARLGLIRDLQEF